MDCIFCKIIAGEILASIVAETDTLVAFHDIAREAPLHILVVPRDHHKDVVELAAKSPAILSELVLLGGQLAAEHSNGSFNLQFNTGADAGQSVFHVHGHVKSRILKGA